MGTLTKEIKVKKAVEEKIVCVFGQGPENPGNKKEFCADWAETEKRKNHLNDGQNPCGNCPFRLHNFN